MATESSKLPEFMVTTVAPNNSPAKDKDGAYEGLYKFDSKSTQGTECDLPVYLLDLEYEGNLAEDEKGEGTFLGRAVSQTKFIETLAKMDRQDLVFYIHGFHVEPRDMIKDTNEMQEHFNLAAEASGKTAPLVVPVDWACTKSPLPHHPGKDYKKDQESSAKAGIAIGRFFSSLKRTGYSPKFPKIHVVAHSMGNRVLRYVGKGAVLVDPWDPEKIPSENPEQGKSLFDAAPKSLQNNRDLFDNLFFVAADIPDTVFESPTVGTKETSDDQTDHALKSGIAALSVMSKRMHVLHGHMTDLALNASRILNNPNGRLGSLGPWDRTGLDVNKEVWMAVSDELEAKVGAEAPYGNVYVKDCEEWSEGSDFGHCYDTALKSVQYYFEYMGQTG